VDAGIPFLAITNEPESTLAQQAARHPASRILWTNTRKDELVSINVVTGMMTATLALAAASVGQLDALRPELERLPELLAALTRLSPDTRQAMLQMFRGTRPIHLLWRGPLKAAAYCGRLALEEVARTPGVPVEGSEFRQGPNEVVDERFAGVIFVAGGRPGELSRSLAAEVTRQGGRVMLVGHMPGAAPAGALVIPMPALPDALLPVLQVVPLQILAHDLALSQGYKPGTVRYITKIITDEESK
jgi:glucosamine--fructose-6-phosphate aminotransferase (isomerizing)